MSDDAPDPMLEPVVVVPPGQWGWAHLPHPAMLSADIHVMPTFDCGRHAFDDACACCPQRIEGPHPHVVHSAWDEREGYEQGLRKHN